MRTIARTRPPLLVTALILTCLFGLASAQVRPFTFTAELSGAAMAEPVATAGWGTAIAVLTGNQLVVTGVYGDLSGPALVATLRGADDRLLRLGADQGALLTGTYAPAVPTLTVSASMAASGGTTGTFSGVFALRDTQVAALKAGEIQLRLTSEAHRGGELHGRFASDVDFGFDGADLVGIWHDDRSGFYHQFTADGVFRSSTSRTLLETDPDAEGRYRLDGHVLTIVHEKAGVCRLGGEDTVWIEGQRGGASFHYTTLATTSGCRATGWHEDRRVNE